MPFTGLRPPPAPHIPCDTPSQSLRTPDGGLLSEYGERRARTRPLIERHPPMSESYNGYCVKCKEKRDFDGEATETNGRRMAKGTCPACGTKMNRILGKA